MYRIHTAGLGRLTAGTISDKYNASIRRYSAMNARYSNKRRALIEREPEHEQPARIIIIIRLGSCRRYHIFIIVYKL